MTNTELSQISSICRNCLGFIFIYHGLLPKILWLSPTEVALVDATGTGMQAATVSLIAGVIEIILGLLVIFYRRSLIPVYVAGLMLIALLGYVAIFKASLLVEAFNPVTTNLPALVLCYLIVKLDPKPFPE
ncbi:DoxX-like family protein [Aestuariirhabdus sp. Z084]|uniref:DoxX-like family protein n=1 Tax=Aestuariirhabdus haliotis TaxID=2918751 RepID=UPI00201B3B98|nr:DoxX-like family protein [Aestuariirhabdus haliotis]MCL6415817.1 DoxX-like family protein [Aestuariirhabdus haliotis]MCL6419881.1 DoxX-like family protein [Aestuariirhabdus haliotis]